MIGKSRVRAGGLLVFVGAMLCALRCAQGQVILERGAEKPWQPPSGFASKQREAAEQDRRTRIESGPSIHSIRAGRSGRALQSLYPRCLGEHSCCSRTGSALLAATLLPGRERRCSDQHHSRKEYFSTTFFVQQTLGIFQPMIQLNYLIFDFGARSARIDEARQQLLGANLTFNRTFLDVLFRDHAPVL